KGDAYEQTRQIRREYYEETRNIVNRIFDQHAPASTLDRHVATMYLFSTLNWLYRWYRPDEGRTPAALAQQIMAQFLNGIVGPTPVLAEPTSETAAPPGKRRADDWANWTRGTGGGT